jgi:hypothetical protein
VFDRCANGQQLKCLTVTDEFTKEGLAIDVDGRIRSPRVSIVLSSIHCGSEVWYIFVLYVFVVLKSGSVSVLSLQQRAASRGCAMTITEPFPQRRGVKQFQRERRSREANEEAKDSEFKKRLEDHSRRIGRIKRAKKFERKESKPLDLLAIGDSWFNYPFPIDYGIVADSQLGSMGNPHPTILDFSWPGEASTTVLGLNNQKRIIPALQGPWLNGPGPDAILVSMGGDDIAGDQFIIYIDYGGMGGVSGRFQSVLDLITASYENLFELRNEFAPGVPIFTHCYDYALPTGIAAAPFVGPWLWPSLQFALYSYTQGVQIVKDMIDKYYALLHGMASIASNNFHLINTRNTIAADTSYPNGWANELHPYMPGFTALARKFLVALQSQFPGRI